MSPGPVPERPFLKPWYRLARGQDEIVLEYGQLAIVFGGRATAELLPALLPLLDGQRTVADIIEALGTPAEPAISKALGLLAEHGLLTELRTGETKPPTDAVQFLAATSAGRLGLAEVADLLERSTLLVAGRGAVADEVVRLLRLSGVEQIECAEIETGPNVVPTLAVAAPDPSELGAMKRWNERALETGTVWLQALPFDGRYACLGPVFVPGETCCFECFRIRQASNLPYAGEFWLLEQVPAPYPSIPPVTRAIAGLAASLALRWLVIEDPSLPGTLFALDFDEGLRISSHSVYRVARCSACSGAADLGSPLPWFDGSLAA
jgi:bacteriocin biosynthesis cyclodehydratase domain-containing protein